MKPWFPRTLLTLRYNFNKIQDIVLPTQSNDGRVNSALAESLIISKIKSIVGEDNVFEPKVRNWYDVLLHDEQWGWFPVDIKITGMKSSQADNGANLASCVYALTDENLDLTKTYNNGKMSELIVSKIKNSELNHNHQKDYFYFVINKTDCKCIINSVKGLGVLRGNLQNPPFQICWYKNKKYKYNTIEDSVKQFIDVIATKPPTWQEIFYNSIRDIRNDRVRGLKIAGNYNKCSPLLAPPSAPSSP